MKNVAVALIVNGSFQSVIMPQKLIGDLAEKFRTEGKTMVHFQDNSVEAEGILILAKNADHTTMILPKVSD